MHDDEHAQQEPHKPGGGAEGGGLGRLSGIEGVVKWFDPRKGFGFIVGPEGQDIFAHYSTIQGDGFRVLRDGSKVRYDAEETDKGWKTTRIERLDPPEISVAPRRTYSRSPRRGG